MLDIEAAVTEKDTTMSTSLRRRRNPTPQPDALGRSRSNQITTRQRKIINMINRTDDDENDEAQKALILEQMESNKQIAKAQFQLLIFLVVMTLITYAYLSFQESDPENKSSLAKALGILFGIKNRNQAGLPSWCKLVSFSSVPKKALLNYRYPSWPWLSSSKTQFLIPGTEDGRRIQQLLHRTLKLKSERGLNVEIFDSNATIMFLDGAYGQQCSAINGRSIREKYEIFGGLGMNQAQKMLWVWCAFYTGQAQGFIDLDLYEVDLSSIFINKLSEKEIQNAIIDASSAIIDDALETDITALASSILFIHDRQSSVAKAMLEFFMGADVNVSDPHNLIFESIQHFNDLIKIEKDSWTLLNANCLEQKQRWPLGALCQGENCCEVTMPKNKK